MRIPAACSFVGYSVVMLWCCTSASQKMQVPESAVTSDFASIAAEARLKVEPIEDVTEYGNIFVDIQDATVVRFEGDLRSVKDSLAMDVHLGGMAGMFRFGLFPCEDGNLAGRVFFHSTGRTVELGRSMDSATIAAWNLDDDGVMEILFQNGSCGLLKVFSAMRSSCLCNLSCNSGLFRTSDCVLVSLYSEFCTCKVHTSHTSCHQSIIIDVSKFDAAQVRNRGDAYNATFAPVSFLQKSSSPFCL